MTISARGKIWATITLVCSPGTPEPIFGDGVTLPKRPDNPNGTRRFWLAFNSVPGAGVDIISVDTETDGELVNGTTALFSGMRYGPYFVTDEGPFFLANGGPSRS